MKTLLFISIVLVSGASAGLLHGVTNLGIVEPYLDIAIGIENKQLLASGDPEQDLDEFWNSYYSYRAWQKSGQVLAGVILGVSMGSLYGIVFALSRPILPGNHHIKKALILAIIMWLVIFFIPFLKYPANPPTVGDAQTIEFRTILYVSFVAISGFGSILFYQISKRINKHSKIIGIGGYACLMIAAFILMPNNPDMVTAPLDLVDGFRIVSVLGVTTFWVALPLIFGALWEKFRPDVSLDSNNNSHNIE